LIGLVLIGVLLSSLHQSFLGGLFLIMKGRIYPLWYSQYLHTLFYMSAIPTGLAVVIMAMYLCSRSLGVDLDFSILKDLSQVIVPMLGLYTIFRFLDLINHGGLHYMFQRRSETLYFWTEIVLFIVLPLALFTQRRVRDNPLALYWTSAILVMGFITNRINVSITSMEAYSHANYVPSWIELAMTAMLIVAAVIVFRLCVLYLDIFPRREVPEPPRERWMSAPASA
jgi:Ni/Fe-hydrogenase subunit HybB-like protein